MPLKWSIFYSKTLRQLTRYIIISTSTSMKYDNQFRCRSLWSRAINQRCLSPFLYILHGELCDTVTLWLEMNLPFATYSHDDFIIINLGLGRPHSNVKFIYLSQINELQFRVMSGGNLFRHAALCITRANSSIVAAPGQSWPSSGCAIILMVYN